MTVFGRGSEAALCFAATALATKLAATMTASASPSQIFLPILILQLARAGAGGDAPSYQATVVAASVGTDAGSLLVPVEGTRVARPSFGRGRLVHSSRRPREGA